jgi:8-oxo-dGTP pyrophosphatase MutT (NUDIX family)
MVANAPMRPGLIDLPRIKSTLDRPRLVGRRCDPGRHASVAMIIEPGDDDLSVLFIERAHRERDPWSGQMAFPGGRREIIDPDEQAVAVRETSEEIGVTLEPGHYLGRLDDLEGRHGGSSAGMVISCFVYGVERPVEASPNHEVAAIARLPFAHMVDAGNRVGVEWREGGERVFPGIRLGRDDPRVVWGLTYRFLWQFFDRFGYRLPHCE